MRTWSEIEAAAGISIPPEVRASTPLGDKIIVIVEVPEKLTKGGLYKPDEVLDRETGGSGWVICLGPDAGAMIAAAAGVSSREEVLGTRLCWGRYAGEPLVVTDRDDEFRSRFRVIKEEHVLLVLGDAQPEGGNEQ